MGAGKGAAAAGWGFQQGSRNFIEPPQVERAQLQIRHQGLIAVESEPYAAGLCRHPGTPWVVQFEQSIPPRYRKAHQNPAQAGGLRISRQPRQVWFSSRVRESCSGARNFPELCVLGHRSVLALGMSGDSGRGPVRAPHE